MFQDVAKSRHLVGVDIVLSYTGTDEDGEPADPGTVTVAVTNFAGTTVTAGAVAVAGNVRTTAIAAADNQSVDRLTAVWSSGGTVLATSQHDVVGGFYATIADIRKDTVLANTNKFLSADLLAVRSEIEYQIDDACKRSFVPRFYSEVLSGSGNETIELRQNDLREVVSAEEWTGSAWAAMSVTVADIPPSERGRATLRSGWWPAGIQNIRVSYRYGWDRPPPDLRRAVVKAVESRRAGDSSGIPSRAISVQGTELGNVVLATPGLGKWITAIPEVDEVINRYRLRELGIGR